MQKDIKDFSVVELKSIVYDNLAQIEQCQANIKAINTELQGRQLPTNKETNMENEEVIGEVVATPETVVVGETEGTE